MHALLSPPCVLEVRGEIQSYMPWSERQSWGRGNQQDECASKGTLHRQASLVGWAAGSSSIRQGTGFGGNNWWHYQLQSVVRRATLCPWQMDCGACLGAQHLGTIAPHPCRSGCGAVASSKPPSRCRSAAGGGDGGAGGEAARLLAVGRAGAARDESWRAARRRRHVMKVVRLTEGRGKPGQQRVEAGHQ